jgi:beta-galactosidase/beta-glucuronidase
MDKTTVVLSKNWRFHLGDEPYAWQAWYDDSSWKEVTVPHDWSVELPFSRDYSSGTGYLAGGIGWYRLRIDPNPSWEGKQISITFDGVYKNSRVWFNSYYLGERPNGYISFTYDVTDQFHFDRENVVVVYVDRREVADSRWFTGSGITRKVTLQIEDAVHPVPYGVFFSTPSASEESAEYVVENELINCSDKVQNITVTNTLLNAEGTAVAAASSTAVLSAGETAAIKTNGTVASPNLWSPATPYLYTLETTITYEDGTVYKADVDKVGIRTFRFDPDKGFFLNGKPDVFKGVCVHHDAGCLGAAVYKDVWYRRLLKLKEMGCNAIRMSHNPHMPELYDLCDELGFYVMDEAFDEWEGPKNKWSTGHNVYPPKHEGYYVNWQTWHEQDLVDMIRRDRNNASVIMWSIGNEIDYPNDPYCHASFQTMTGNNDKNKPAAERQYNPSRPDASRLGYLSKKLCAIVKKADPTHPVTLAAAFPELSVNVGFIDDLDVVGFNYKEHLYEENHKNFPDKPFLGSENSHMLKAWKAVTDNEYISGQFLWTGIDYLGEAHGWPVRGSYSGIITTAGFEKASYYRRQSFWAEKPVIHVTTIRPEEYQHEYSQVSEVWNYVPGEEIMVRIFTNLPEAELFLNDESLGIFKRDENVDAIVATVKYAPGKLTAKAVAADGTVVAHSIETTGCACQMDVKVFDEAAALKQIEVTLLDSEGRRVYTDTTMLHVTVENGKLLGIENGDQADVTDFSFPARRAFRGQLLIYAVADEAAAEPMKITISGPQIKKTII